MSYIVVFPPLSLLNVLQDHLHRSSAETLTTSIPEQLSPCWTQAHSYDIFGATAHGTAQDMLAPLRSSALLGAVDGWGLLGLTQCASGSREGGITALLSYFYYYPIFIITLFFKYRHGSGSYHPAFWVYGVFHVCVLLWCLPVPCGVLMFIHLLCVFSLSVFIHFSSVHPTLSCFQVYEMMLLQVFMFQVSMFMSPFLKIKLGFCLSALGSTRSLHKVSFSPTVTVTVKKYYRVCGLPEWRWWLRWHWSVSPPSWRLSEQWRTNLLAHLAEDPENAQLVWVGTPAHLNSSVKGLPCCRYGWEVRKHWDKKVG